MDNIIINKTEYIEYLQFKKLLEFQDDLVHAYSLKTHRIGFRRGGRNYTADESYNKLCMALEINRAYLVHPDQQHTDNICEYSEEDTMSLAKVDGIITDVPNIATVLTFADCMSLLMYDPKNKIIANIHSGWKGTIKRIGEKAIQKMVKDYNCKTENIICCFGPCIRKDHFLVNEDVKDYFENEFKDLVKKNSIIENTEYSNEFGKQYRVDTVLLNKLLLKEVGLIDENIIDSNICTVCNSGMFHSRRAEGEEYQANAGLMMLRKHIN